MIKEAYCFFEVAKLLKEKGFNEPTWTCYIEHEIFHYDYTSSNSELIDGVISAPTHQMAMAWLREVYDINIDVVSIWNQKRWEYQIYIITPTTSKCPYKDDTLYMSYEEAVEAALIYTLENLV